MKRFLSAILSALLWMTSAVANDTSVTPEQRDAQVEALFTPGRDLFDVKLAVDALVDPSADTASIRAQMDELVATLLPMAAGVRGDHNKLKVLRKFLYESGPWNGNKPFAYDMTDRFGKKLENKQIGTYLRTRLGNCVSMPILVTILGRRMGLKMTLALAPFHTFVKFSDETGREWNLEATSGAGYTRDLWVRKENPMSDVAVAKGTYLRALSDEEAKAELATLLIEDDMIKGRFSQAAVTSTVILRHFPTLVSAMIWRGSALARILDRDILPHYQTRREMPPDVQAFADNLYTQNRLDFAAAEALGWTENEGEKQ
jgi:Transglutaminase-like superfamily